MKRKQSQPHGNTKSIGNRQATASIRGRIVRTLLCSALWIGTSLSPGLAVELWSGEGNEYRLSLDTAFKVSGLGSYAPEDPMLFPERSSGVGLFRFRSSLDAQYSDRVNLELAYEHRARVATENAGMAGSTGILPSEGMAPYRLSPLDWELAESDSTFAYRHEVDRAFVGFHPRWGEIILGRQAIGLGRGVLFGAVDIFSPFSPLEVDREWRRGVDAARIEYRVTATSSVGLITAFGESWDDSAIIGHARGYVGNIDGELIVGKRAEDEMYSATVSAIFGGAEVHLEMALFDTPEEQPDGGLFGNDQLAGKGVLGTSYTFGVGNGLTLLGEYHYSGFGVKEIEDVMARLAEPTFQERYLRGDTQILGQHALGIQLSYPINLDVSAALLVLESPVDGSGLAAPSINWQISQHTSFVASAFIPWGNEPSEGNLSSEYGGAPASLFLQFNMYY